MDCMDWEDNPERITSKKIGSRNSQTTIYFNNKKTQIICGCFSGTLEKFKQSVNEEYSEFKPETAGHEYFKQYTAFILNAENYIKANSNIIESSQIDDDDLPF